MLFSFQEMLAFLFSLDAVATFLALVATVLLAKNNKLGWPICLIAIAVDTVFNYQRALGGQFLLTGIYFVTTCYGWWQWKKQDKASTQPTHEHIRVLTHGQIAVCGISCIVLFFTFLSIIQALPFSSNTRWDALAMTLSFIAQLLLTQRYLQSWIMWFVADLVTAGLYYQQSAYWHASLYMIYLVIATIAYYKWREKYLAMNQNATNFVG